VNVVQSNSAIARQTMRMRMGFEEQDGPKKDDER